jgi:transketolase
MIGDGEADEGQIWEATMSAAKYKVDNLTAILDYNKYQQTGPVADVMPALQPYAEKWRAFGWHVVEIDGHDLEQIVTTLKNVRVVQDQPQMIIAHTLKGKGLSPFEKNETNRKHGVPLSDEEVEIALSELDKMYGRSEGGN